MKTKPASDRAYLQNNFTRNSRAEYPQIRLDSRSNVAIIEHNFLLPSLDGP